jgi:predicted transglutaminase-like cysteine proteinase
MTICPQRPLFLQCILLLCTLFACLPSPAQGFGRWASQLRITQFEHREDIAADYTSQSTVILERQALSDQGAIVVGKINVSFNPDLESMEIVEAFTEKSDGRKFPVLPHQINEQKGYLAPGTQVSWPGLNTFQITFPQVQNGDKTMVRYRKKTHRPALPQWLNHFDYLSNAFDILSYKVQLTAPMEMPLELESQGMKLHVSTEQGRKHWVLEGSNFSSSDAPNMANALKHLPYWMYSTLPSRQALGDAFTQATWQKMVITPDIQTLANQITKGLNKDFDKAQAIARWIAKEMRYVAIFVGTGGFIPNDLPLILKNRYGDCKDHALLMMSLLKAAGIDSAPVLINTANADWTPPIAAAVYNHVLVYIPVLNLFSDPTASQIPFGQLPWADSAKPVVVGLASGSREMRTPAFDAKDNRIQIQSIWRIDAQGHAQADLKVDTWGEAATTMQNQLLQIPAGFSGSAVQQFLKAAGLTGRGFLQYPPVQRQSQTQSFSAQIELPHFLATPEAASVNPHPMISSLPMYVLNNLGPQLDKDRRFDMLCTPISIAESFELHLPKHAHVLSLPRDMVQNQSGITYRSHYRQQGASIVGERHFERAPSASGHICTVEELEKRREALEGVRKDVRSIVLFKLP